MRTRKDLAFALRITLNSVLLTVTSDSGSVCRGVFLTRFVAPEDENINLRMKERDIAEQEKREGGTRRTTLDNLSQFGIFLPFLKQHK